MRGLRQVALAASLVVGTMWAVAGCSDDDEPERLAGDCAVVFAAPAQGVVGTCHGDDGTIDIGQAICKSGPRLMLAERHGGEDYAWARVGGSWHKLAREGTNFKAFRDCTDN